MNGIKNKVKGGYNQSTGLAKISRNFRIINNNSHEIELGGLNLDGTCVKKLFDHIFFSHAVD